MHLCCMRERSTTPWVQVWHKVVGPYTISHVIEPNRTILQPLERFPEASSGLAFLGLTAQIVTENSLSEVRSSRPLGKVSSAPDNSLCKAATPRLTPLCSAAPFASLYLPSSKIIFIFAGYCVADVRSHQPAATHHAACCLEHIAAQW